jgi:hypothetical protein
MNDTVLAVLKVSLVMSCLVLMSLLIIGIIRDTNMRALALDHTPTTTGSHTPDNNSSITLRTGPPQRMTIPLDSQQPTILSEAKKQQLMQSHHQSPPLPSSGRPIRGPTPGTQISP